MNKLIGEVAFPLQIYQTFDYLIPKQLMQEAALGKRVLVPFRNEGKVEGFLVGFKEKSEYKGQLQEIIQIVDPEPPVNEQDLELARWISNYYLCPLGMVLKAIIPTKISLQGDFGKYVKYVCLTGDLTQTLTWMEKLSQQAPQQAAVLKALLIQDAPLTVKELLKRVNCSEAPLRALLSKRIVAIEPRKIKGAPQTGFYEKPSQVTLNEGQQVALKQIHQALSGTGESFLLHGVNNSGKTEVYMQAVRKALDLGKQAIVVVPEISLTPQLIARFRSRFADELAVYHSGLTEAERSKQWLRIKNGEAKVVIGVRAAVFAPFSNLGLIVIDEEHESTYKQEDPSPRYHLREVAQRRAELAKATVVMGSATPSLETYYRAMQGDLKLLELKERVIRGSPPKITIVDMAKEVGLISRILKQKIVQRLKQGEQIILLLNRRGFAAAICRRCRGTLKCPGCRIPLTYHFNVQQLRCHYCGYTLKFGRCHKCGAKDLRFFGAGTERVELELAELFPLSNLKRMDSDAVRRSEHGFILEEFRQGKIQILLGTQMISLGLDFPNVTLVGIISADTLLDLPDFRAGERTFQLISQAAGRAGRGEKEGEVIIQTHHPEHYAIQMASQCDYLGFYKEEIGFRKEFNYPPFSRLIQLLVEDRDAAKAEEGVERLREFLRNFDAMEILGPSKAMPFRLRGLVRFQILLKLKTKEPSTVKDFLKEGLKKTGLERKVKLDVDPY